MWPDPSAADESIPVYTDLASVFATLGDAVNHAERWAHLADEFKARFGRAPAYIARAPGRVNLIGEHVDYALFGVLPAAIERDILVACAPCAPAPVPGAEGKDEERPNRDGAGHVNAENLNGKYGPQAFAPVRKGSGKPAAEEPTEAEVHVEEWHLDIDKRELRWESYVKAGYYGVLNRFFHPSKTQEHPVPVDILVTGTVPAGSGLSSSAAMVVASTLAFLAVNNKLDNLTKGELVELAMENERRVGVNSGGMDQAASVIAAAGSALYITFYPRLAADLVPLPGAHASTRLGGHFPGAERPVYDDDWDDFGLEPAEKEKKDKAKKEEEERKKKEVERAMARARMLDRREAEERGEVYVEPVEEKKEEVTTAQPEITSTTAPGAADQTGASLVTEVPAASGTSTDAPATTTTEGDAKDAPAAPLEEEPLEPPPPFARSAVVIANSLVVADKAVLAPRHYNLRVLETLAAARALARAMQVPVDADPAHYAPGLDKERITLREVLGRWVGLGFEGLDTSEGLIIRETKGGREEVGPEGLMEGLREVKEGLELIRPKGKKDGEELGVSWSEMIELTGLSEDVFKTVYKDQLNVEAEKFQLYKRAKHVFDEAYRVLQFRELCLDSAIPTGHTTEDTLKSLGALMNASQISCKELFECTCPEVDELCALALSAGAYGARVTGAGWGGCIVALVPADETESFVQKLKAGYAPYKDLEGEKLREAVFASKPSSGASVYKVTE